MLNKFQQIPKAMQLLAAGLCALALLAGTALVGKTAFLIAAVGIALVTGAIFAWQLYIKWQGQRRTRAMTGHLTAHSSAKPGSISDPAQLAQLDRLRENFARGIEKFHAVGKDLYSLPWYVVCGEPGSGKTEAVRRCKVGFPPGLQDEMQGAGGTINMHWWFTNHAVLIDTAGKLLFQEVQPGSTNEWTEFLKLLRTSRPHCPINGLLLVIPSESLIKDTFEEIEVKARKIADQLKVIQRTLDVRFPVFVLITKCDKIVGFREFFAGIKNQQLQDQMTGWSNPAPLDSPFQMEAVNQHLAEVVKRIGRRQLGMLKDPVPTDAGKKRLDEVDSLYALTASISGLAPRLRKYLETIFGPTGAAGGKPLFLRGIYFTSALTEGKELDTELAAALGLSEDQLPSSKAWERERSFFLKDLFLHKIFREKGLVTRASNTDKLVRTRQMIIGGVALAGLLSVLAVSIMGYLALKNSVGSELVFWRPAARPENWSGSKWKPVVNSRLEYTGNDIIQLDDKREWSILQFHDTLQRRVSTDMQIPLIYRPLEAIAVRTNPSRRQAQRILFEASVVAPVVEANRDRLVNSTEWDEGDSARLAALIRLESSIHLKGLPGYDADYPAEEFFNPLLGPSLAKLPAGSADLDTLMKIFDWTYRVGAGKGQWPAVWLSRGQSLRDNQPLNRGWDALERSVHESLGVQMQTVQSIRTGRLAVVRFLESEKSFLRALAEPRTARNWKQDVAAAWEDLIGRRAAVDRLHAELKARVKAGEDVMLETAYRATLDGMRRETERASQLIRATLLKQKPAADAAAAATSGAASEYTLHRDFDRKLAALNQHVSSQLEKVLPPSEEAQLADLDAAAFNPVNDGLPAYAVRFEAYSLGMELLTPPAGSAPKADAPDTLRARAAKYMGPLRQEFRNAVTTMIEASAAPGGQGN